MFKCLQNKLVLVVLTVVMLVMMCGCSNPDAGAQKEVNTLVRSYQEAINRGDYNSADNCCALEDGKQGAWFFHENSITITDDTPIYNIACQELGDERYFIDIYNVDIFDDTAIVETCIYQCSTPEAIAGLASYYDISELEKLNLDSCKEKIKDYVYAYTYMYGLNIECKQINGEWKITKMN